MCGRGKDCRVEGCRSRNWLPVYVCAFRATEETARPLFEWSSQAKQIEHVDQRLASVSKHALEQHRINLARLTEPSAPLGTVKNMENLSEIDDTGGLDLDHERT
jgi:hypothetical protein